MNFDIASEEINWLRENYSELTFFPGTPPLVNGTFNFDAQYKDEVNKKEYPRIKDAYDIEIVFSNIPPSSLPQVKETGGRIKKVKENFALASLADVHMYPNGNLCLCTYPEEKQKFANGFNLKDFFEKLLIPYFYAQSYYEKEKTWIWGERSHGVLGLLESYLENRQNGENYSLTEEYLDDLKQLVGSEPFLAALKKNKIVGHWLCFCNSKLQFRNCHTEAFRGLWNLKEDIKKNSIDL